MNETEQKLEELYIQELERSELSNQDSPSSSPNREIPNQQHQILVGNFSNAAQILQKIDSAKLQSKSKRPFQTVSESSPSKENISPESERLNNNDSFRRLQILDRTIYS